MNDVSNRSLVTVMFRYSKFVISEEEADWVGLDLNEAARKQQDIEDSRAPQPLKYK